MTTLQYYKITVAIHGVALLSAILYYIARRNVLLYLRKGTGKSLNWVSYNRLIEKFKQVQETSRVSLQ